MEKRWIAISTFGLILVFAGCMTSVSNDAYRDNNFPLVKKANPLVGTDGYGHTYPGASLPFGMVQLSPGTGDCKADRDGMYRFWTCSDDGSRLYVDSEQVVDNDGFYGAQFASGLVALAAGYHEIKVIYFEGQVDEKLEVDVAAPDSQRRPVDSQSLYRKR